MRLTGLLIILFVLSLTSPATGQEYSYARYDVKDGLAGAVVYHGVEDKDGFLWFATETGVSRFDGTRFRNFTISDGLPDNEILRLYVDSRNRVWMMPFSNSLCYYLDGKIHTPDNDSLLKKLDIESYVLGMVEDGQGNLMIAEAKQLHFLRTGGQVMNIRKIGGTTFEAGATGLNSDGRFTILLQLNSWPYGHAQFELTPEGRILGQKPYLFLPTALHFTYFSPRLTINRHQDSLLIHSLEEEGNRHRLPLLPSFNSMSILNDTLVSVNTAKGAFYYDISKRQFTRQVLQGKSVNAVFVDSEGNHWFSTAGAGIFRVGSFEFSNYTFSINNKDNLSVFSLNKFDSVVYIGTDKSLLFQLGGSHRQPVPYKIEGFGLNNRISAIVRLASGHILLGTDEGVVEFKGKWRFQPNPFSVKSLHVIDGHQLLLSMQQGLILLVDQTNRIHLMVERRSTCSYKIGNTYFNGTLQGLYQIDSTCNPTWLGEKEPSLRKRIADVEGAPDGSLWIATPGEGVIRYKDGKVIRKLCRNDGLTSDVCRTVFIAGKEVWVGTDKGLNRVQWQGDTYKITTYTSADGLLSNIVNAIYVDGSQVYVGTPAGLTTFDANKISLNSFCKLRMTGIQAASFGPWMQDTTGFTLPPQGNNIRFDFAGISYRSAGDITYRYRLVGLQADWQTTRETFLSYLSLPSGEYELQLVATNKFGVESNMLRIPFLVEKFLWEKTWFRIGALLVAWVLIWLFIHARVKRVRRQNDEKLQINNRMAELEQMALKAQMNPHFIFNSLNSVQQYVIDKDIQGANKFITEFSRLIRLTLDISSKTKISIEEEISYLTTYLELEKTKFEDVFTYHVEVVPDLHTPDWFIPPMILQPYVENSIRHGVRYRNDRQGHIHISFELNQQYLVCRVEDNGVGRRKAGQYKSAMPIEYQSKGMTLTAKRIEMLNQHQADPVLIYIEDLENGPSAAGTRVTLKFPLQDAGRYN